MIPLIQLPDHQQMKPGYVQACGLEHPYYGASQFLVGHCAGSHHEFFAKVDGAPLNLNRDGLGNLDTTTITAMEEIVNKRIDRKVAVNEWFLYTLKVLGFIDAGVLQSLHVKPRISSEWRAATEGEVLQFLKLPQARDGRLIGTMKDTNIGLYFNRRAAFMHMLVSGTTGQGKSNVLGSIVEVSQMMNACVWLLDHKPDFQHMHQPNREGQEDHYRGLENIRYWYLGEPIGTPGEQPIIVQASDLSVPVLAASIFYLEGEELQAEIFEAFLNHYRDTHPDQPYRLDTVISDMPTAAAQATALLGFPINAANWDATRRKLQLPGRVPSWVDGPLPASVNRQILQPRAVLVTKHFSLTSETKSQQVNVIRIGDSAGGSRGYALFISYLFSKQSSLQKERRAAYEAGQPDHGYTPVVNLIDEAQDLLSHQSRKLRAAVTNTIHEEMRKARSLQFGYALSVQQASSVPENIQNLINSRIAMRFNNEKEARASIPSASDAEIERLQTLGPGEALVQFAGANDLVHGVMRRAAFHIPQPHYEDDE